MMLVERKRVSYAFNDFLCVWNPSKVSRLPLIRKSPTSEGSGVALKEIVKGSILRKSWRTRQMFMTKMNRTMRTQKC